MSESKTSVSDAYSLKTPEDSIHLYKTWASTYDQDFAIINDYRSPGEISKYFNQFCKETDTPILDVGAGTGLIGELINKTLNRDLIALDISKEMLTEAERKGCYSSFIEADLTKKLDIENSTIGAVVSAGTFTYGHVGPEAFDELLRITKPDGLFVLSIHSKLFFESGFDKKLDSLNEFISKPVLNEVNVYGNHPDPEHSDQTIYVTLFRKK